MKIYTVTFNNGGWYSGSMPSYTVVAQNKEESIDKVLVDNPHYRSGHDVWASEFKIEGYVIEVYDEKVYKRDKNIDEICN
jgi:hypothetical protein